MKFNDVVCRIDSGARVALVLLVLGPFAEGAGAAVRLQAQVLTTTVTVGGVPSALAVDELTNKVYVLDGNNVAVIDGATNTAVTLADPNAVSPQAIAVNTLTKKVYVANSSSNNVTVIDEVTGTVTTVKDPNAVFPVALAVNPTTNKVYIANFQSNNVTVIDGATNAATTIAVDRGPNSIAVNPMTNKVYVATEFYSLMVNFGEMQVIDGATNSVSTIAGGQGWDSFAVDQSTNMIYAAERPPDDTVERSYRVLVIDGATDATSSVDVGANPFAVELNPLTNMIYVGSEGENRVQELGGDTVTAIDGTTDATSTIAVGNRVAALAVNPVTNRIFVANNGSNNVTVIDGATNLTTTIKDPRANNPLAVAVNTLTNKIYVANGSGNVTVIDGSAIPALAPSQFANISTRAFVGTGGNIAIAGFVIAGGADERVLIRGVGPTLSEFSVGGVLTQPVLTLFDASGAEIASNTGWSSNSNVSEITAAFAVTGAFSLPPGSADSALLLSLAPGAYTAQVSGLNDTTGNALIEVYQVPTPTTNSSSNH